MFYTFRNLRIEVQLPTTPTNRPAAAKVATIGSNKSVKGTKLNSCRVSASAILLTVRLYIVHRMKKLEFPVHVGTVKGYELTVDGRFNDGVFSCITLTGPVKLVFSGEIDLDSLDFVSE